MVRGCSELRMPNNGEGGFQMYAAVFHWTWYIHSLRMLSLNWVSTINGVFAKLSTSFISTCGTGEGGEGVGMGNRGREEEIYHTADFGKY